MGPVWTYSSCVQGVTSCYCYHGTIVCCRPDILTQSPGRVTRVTDAQHHSGKIKWIGQKGLKNKRQCEKCWICFGFFSYCPVSVHPDTGCSGQSVHSHNLGVKSQHELYRILDMFGWNVAIRYPGVWQPNSIECILVDCIWWWAQEILVAQCCRLIVWDVVVDCDLEMLHYWHLPSPSPCFPGVQL